MKYTIFNLIAAAALVPAPCAPAARSGTNYAMNRWGVDALGQRIGSIHRGIADGFTNAYRRVVPRAPAVVVALAYRCAEA